jgi:hypothetical protein
MGKKARSAPVVVRNVENGQTFAHGSGECVPVPRYLADQIRHVGPIDQGAGVLGQECRALRRISNTPRS